MEILLLIGRLSRRLMAVDSVVLEGMDNGSCIVHLPPQRKRFRSNHFFINRDLRKMSISHIVIGSSDNKNGFGLSNRIFNGHSSSLSCLCHLGF